MPFTVFELSDDKIKQFKARIVKLENGCWDLTTAKDRNGYNRFPIRKSYSASAHRISWQIFKGIEGLTEGSVCHKCDNPPCVNPDHLYLGDAKQNTDDRFNRNRYATILKKEQIPEIITKYATGLYSQTSIAKMYDVTQSAISRVVNKKRWQQYT